MNEAIHDPVIESLFHQSEDSMDGEDFVDDVMKRVSGARRRRLAGQVAIGGLIALLAWYVKDASTPLSQWMVVSLVDLGNGLVAEILAPLNSVGTLVAATLLGLRAAYKRIRGV